MCFVKRKKPACIVAVLSGVVFALSCLMILLSVRFTEADVWKAINSEDAEIEKLKNTTFYILATFSAIALVLSVWGLCLVRCEGRCCSMIFGLCLLPTWATTFVFGCLIAWFSNSSKSTIQQFCNNDDWDSFVFRWGRDLVAEYDDGIGSLVNSVMCSKECPCSDNPSKNIWL